jgi:hypothetical protein
MTDLKDSPVKCPSCGSRDGIRMCMVADCGESHLEPTKFSSAHAKVACSDSWHSWRDAQAFAAELMTSAAEPDFCVCDYRPQRKCSVHPEESEENAAKAVHDAAALPESREMPGQRSERSMGSEYPAQQLSMSHDYLSTACFHGQCSDCRITCKFCSTKCSHICHTASAPSGNAGSQPVLESPSAARIELTEADGQEFSGWAIAYYSDLRYGEDSTEEVAIKYAKAYADRSIAPLRERLEKAESKLGQFGQEWDGEKYVYNGKS